MFHISIPIRASVAVMMMFLGLTGLGLCSSAGESDYFALIQNGKVTGYSQVQRYQLGGVSTYEEKVFLPYRFFPGVIVWKMSRDSHGRVIRWDQRRIFDGGEERTLLWSVDDRFYHLNDFNRFLFYNDRLESPGEAWPITPFSPGLIFELFDAHRNNARPGRSQEVKVFLPGGDCIPRLVNLTGEGEYLVMEEPFKARARIRFGQVESVELPGYRIKYQPRALRPVIDGIEPPGSGIAMAPSFRPEPHGYKVRPVTIPSRGGIVLSGEMKIPDRKGPRPAFVLLPGTGPHDRSGGGLISTLSHHMARMGVVTLAFDRRGTGESIGDYSSALGEDFLSDGDSAVNFLACQDEVDPLRIGILGHSEGALTAARIARENRHIRGIILMASPSREMFPHIAREQIQALENHQEWSNTAVEAFLDSIEAVRSALDQKQMWLNLGGERLYLGLIASYYRWPDPLMVAGDLKMPVLILHGRDDSIIPLHHSYNLNLTLKQSGNRNITLVVFTDTGHFFGAMVDAGESFPHRQYVRVHSQVIRAVTEWIAETYHLPDPGVTP